MLLLRRGRKHELLEKQGANEGMREYGSMSIPQKAFIAALRTGDEG
jgi:GTP-binding protein LepA